jgi:hypothetical protein
MTKKDLKQLIRETISEIPTNKKSKQKPISLKETIKSLVRELIKEEDEEEEPIEKKPLPPKKSESDLKKKPTEDKSKSITMDVKPESKTWIDLIKYIQKLSKTEDSVTVLVAPDDKTNKKEFELDMETDIINNFVVNNKTV